MVTLPTGLGRFRAALVNEMVGKVLKETLADKQYSAEEAKQWSREISDTVQGNLKGIHSLSVEPSSSTKESFGTTSPTVVHVHP